jgi:hypothetical protein
MKCVNRLRNFGSCGLNGEKMTPTISDFTIFKNTGAEMDGGNP